MENAIEIRNLTFAYQAGIKVIKNISFNIKTGSYTVILGHNGSGKSTIARLILGLLMADTGSIFINGVELNQKNVYDIRKQIGIVFQNPDNQFIGSTVADDIAFGLENRCVEHEKMQAIIDDFAAKVGMQEFLDKEPSNLSGGQKQRVAIAGILAMAPKILIFDEATSMLDPKGKREIKELIKKTKEIYPDITVVSITHDIDEAYLADEVIVLNQGEIFAQGSPAEIFKEEQNLEAIGLDFPFIYKLTTALKAQGLDYSGATIEELVMKICQ
ncbi:energy-coupling factor transporter ATPase [bacterium]|jgi:energy-coupling factor transport system ATP-binding protein|nr:energy-coupling factor transporter ATPase [bacterium]